MFSCVFMCFSGYPSFLPLVSLIGDPISDCEFGWSFVSLSLCVPVIDI